MATTTNTTTAIPVVDELSRPDESDSPIANRRGNSMMDFDNPAIMFSGMLIGAIGLGLFIYGKNTPDFRFLISGIALSVLPFFAHTMLALWGLTGLCASVLYLSKR